MLQVEFSASAARRMLKALISLGSKKGSLTSGRKKLIRKLANRFHVDFFEIAASNADPLKRRPKDPNERQAVYLATSCLFAIDPNEEEFELLERLATIYKLGPEARKLDFAARAGDSALDGITCEELTPMDDDEESVDLVDLQKFIKPTVVTAIPVKNARKTNRESSKEALAIKATKKEKKEPQKSVAAKKQSSKDSASRKKSNPKDSQSKKRSGAASTEKKRSRAGRSQGKSSRRQEKPCQSRPAWLLEPAPRSSSC